MPGLIKDKWLIAGLGVAAAAAVIYALWPKKDLPGKATAVQPFDLNRYVGKWHEIARMPNKPEENVHSLTETYTRRDDGIINVLTRAFDTQRNRWVKAAGKAKPAVKQNLGKLKVSYFGPFYFHYNILDIDDDYHYALVSGRGLDLLWILSREKTIPEVIKDRFINHARGIGFDTDRLEWPKTA